MNASFLWKADFYEIFNRENYLFVIFMSEEKLIEVGGSEKGVSEYLRPRIDFRDIFSAAFVIAGISTFSYFIAFIFEYSYFGTFKISSYFIPTSRYSIYVSIGFILLIFFTFYILIDFISIFFKKEHINNIYIYKVLLLTPAIFFILTNLIFYGFNWKKISVSFYFFGALLASEFIFPLFNFSKKNYTEKLQADIVLDKKGFSLTQKFIRSKPRIFFLIFICMVIVWVAMAAGESCALKKKSYLIIKDSSEIVLKIFEDNAILVDYNTSTKVISKTYSIVPLEDLKSEKLTEESIGPLKFN